MGHLATHLRPPTFGLTLIGHHINAAPADSHYYYLNLYICPIPPNHTPFLFISNSYFKIIIYLSSPAIYYSLNFTMSTSQLPPFIILIDDFQILICTICQQAVPSRDPLSHITKHDPTIASNTRILTYIEGILPTLQPIQEAYTAIRYRGPIRALPSLPPPVLGSQCNYENCLTISTSKALAILHLRKAHGLRGPSNELEVHLHPSYYQGLQKNRFFFATQAPNSTPQGLQDPLSPGPLSPPPFSRETLSPSPGTQAPTSPAGLSLAQLSLRPASESATTTIARLRAHHISQHPPSRPRALGLITRQGTSGFHEFSQYEQLLRGRAISKLKALFELSIPNAHLPVQDLNKFLLLAISSLFRASEDLLPHVSRLALIRLMQFSKEKEGIRPLRALQEDSTITRYATTFRALVIFLLNSHPFQMARRDTDLRGLYRSPLDLGSQLSRLQEILTSLVRKPRGDPTEAPTPAQPLAADTPYDSEDEELEAQEALQTPLSSESSWLDHLPFDRTTIQSAASLLQDLFLGLARLTVKEGKDTPLYIFTACYGLDYSQGNFKPINLIAQAYSAIVRGYQFLVLLESFEPVDPEVYIYPPPPLSLSPIYIYILYI